MRVKSVTLQRQKIIGPFSSSLFWFYGLQLYCFGSLCLFSYHLLQMQQADKPAVHYLLNTKQQTDTVSNKLANIAQHLLT